MKMLWWVSRKNKLFQMAVFTYAKKFFYRFVEELVTVYRIQLILFTSSLTLENELFNYCEQYSF